MYIAFVGVLESVTYEGGNPGYTAAVSPPPGTVAGNVLIAQIVQSGGTSPGVTLPAGWTLIFTDSQLSADQQITTFAYHVFNAGETSYTFTLAATSLQYLALIVSAWSGVTSIGPYAIGTASSEAGAGDFASPTLTTTLPNCTVLSAGSAYCAAQDIVQFEFAESYYNYNPDDYVACTLTGILQYSAGTSTSYDIAYEVSDVNMEIAAYQIALASVSDPLAPTLNSPANSSAAPLAGTPTFSWTYNNTDGTTQQDWAFRMKISGAGSYSYWNLNTTSWQSTIVWNAGGLGAYTFPSGSFTNGDTYNWSVATESTASVQGPFATDFVVLAQTAPTVSVTAPTGTIGYSMPEVTWTETLADGASQIAYQVRTFSEDQYSAPGFNPASSTATDDSGVVASSDLGYTVGTTLPATADGIAYESYVQITQSGPQSSGWSEYTSFTVELEPPTTPTMTATASTDETTGCPVIALTVQGDNNIEADSLAAVITRSDGLYVRNASMTNQLPLPSDDSYLGSVNDYEAIPATGYTYTAVVYATTSDGSVRISATSDPTSSVTLDTTGWWELDPTNPSTAIDAQPTEFNPIYTEQSAANLVLNQSTPNVVANAMGGQDGTATFETFSNARYNGISALLLSQKTIFVSSPWGTYSGYYRFGPQSGGMSTGYGNQAKSSNLLPSTSSAPHVTLDITWVAQPRPGV